MKTFKTANSIFVIEKITNIYIDLINKCNIVVTFGTHQVMLSCGTEQGAIDELENLHTFLEANL